MANAMKGARVLRVLLFLPKSGSNAAELGSLRDDALARFRGLDRVVLADLAPADASVEQRERALEEALRGLSGKGFVIVDPPTELEGLRSIDRVCRAVSGGKRGRLPRGVFFEPKRGDKEGADDAERAALRECYRYFRKDRRSITFTRPKQRAMRKALKLSRKTRSPIRWGMIVPMTAVAGVLAFAAFVLRDPFLKRHAVSAGETVFGARVSIDSLSTSLPPAIAIEGMTVADRSAPMTNLFEFDELESDIDLVGLVEGRVLVDRAALTGLAFGTERSESGALEPGEAGTSIAEHPLTKALGSRLDAVFELILRKLEPPELEELHTIRAAQDLREQAAERLESLRERIAKSPTRAALAAAKTDLEQRFSQTVPERVTQLRARIDGLTSLSGDSAVQAFDAGVAELAAIDFGPEATLLKNARAKADAAAKGVQQAEKTLREAAAIQKIDFTTITKLPKLKQDIDASIQAARSAQEQLSSAKRWTDDAVQGIATKKKASQSALDRANKALAQVRSKASAPGTLWSGFEGELAAAKQDVAALRTEMTAAVQRVEGELANAATEVESVKAFVQEGAVFLRGAKTTLEEAAQRDRDELVARYTLSDVDTEEMLGALVGESLAGWLQLAWTTHQRLRPYLSRDDSDGEGAAEPAKHDAPGGGTIYDFPSSTPETDQPSFWVREAEFLGTLELDGGPLVLRGTATDLSSSPARTQRDATASFEAEGEAGTLGGDLRYTGTGALELEVRAGELDVDGVEFASRYAPGEVQSGSVGLSIRAAFEPDGMRADVGMQVADLVLEPRAGADIDERLAPLMSALYAGYDAFEVSLGITSTGGELGPMTVQSDLGPRLGEVVQSALGAQVDATRAEAEARFELVLREALGELDGVLATFGTESDTLVQGLVGESDTLGALLGQRRALLEGGLDDAWRLPEAAEVSAQLDSARATLLADLERRLQAEQTRIAGGHSTPDDSAKRLLADIPTTGDLWSKTEASLRAELDRLIKLP